MALVGVSGGESDSSPDCRPTALWLVWATRVQHERSASLRDGVIGRTDSTRGRPRRGGPVSADRSVRSNPCSRGA
ncbi:hypothetical protein BRC90_11180 [Halobacteriales archaeon QS_4_69_34]|nr:MAG: hypothetical protein BRC90_11180 [Halobacteriales archaeon QS_4_69_34]